MGLYQLIFKTNENRESVASPCEHAFTLELFVCFIDKDECAGSNNCQQKCIDGLGTYTCGCNTGYRLNDTNLISCLRKSTSIYN